MKKLLSILGAIGLTATSTTSLVACNKPDNRGVINLNLINHNNHPKIVIDSSLDKKREEFRNVVAWKKEGFWKNSEIE